MTAQLITSEVLNKAADALQADGWWNPQVPAADLKATATCAANVIWYATGQDGVAAQPAQEALLRHIGGRRLEDIFDWNDAPDRSAAEVIETLRAAAVIEAAKEQADANQTALVDVLATWAGSDA